MIGITGPYEVFDGNGAELGMELGSGSGWHLCTINWQVESPVPTKTSLLYGQLFGIPPFATKPSCLD